MPVVDMSTQPLCRSRCEGTGASPGTAEKLIKASAVSNGMIEAGNSRHEFSATCTACFWQEKHLKQWKSLINRRCLKSPPGPGTKQKQAAVKGVPALRLQNRSRIDSRQHEGEGPADMQEPSMGSVHSEAFFESLKGSSRSKTIKYDEAMVARLLSQKKQLVSFW